MTDSSAPGLWRNLSELEELVFQLADRLLAAEQRIQALEATANLRQQDEDAERAMAPAPAGGLVERVAEAIHDEAGSCHATIEARAAILAVAEWLETQLRGTGTTTGCIAARWLREEVERG